jgi:hypothetical protein
MPAGDGFKVGDATVKITGALLKSMSVPKKLPATARTPGVKVKVSITGEFVESTPPCAKRPPIAEALHWTLAVEPGNGELWKPFATPLNVSVSTARPALATALFQSPWLV